MSVVIDQIDVRDVRALEFEYEPPIAGNRNRPLSFSLALHGVKPKTRVVQIARTVRSVERGEQNPQPSGMPCIDPPRISRAEKSLQALVSYSRDHSLSVTYRLSHFQSCLRAFAAAQPKFELLQYGGEIGARHYTKRRTRKGRHTMLKLAIIADRPRAPPERRVGAIRPGITEHRGEEIDEEERCPRRHVALAGPDRAAANPPPSAPHAGRRQSSLRVTQELAPCCHAREQAGIILPLRPLAGEEPAPGLDPRVARRAG
jgi:hypothetical protein